MLDTISVKLFRASTYSFRVKLRDTRRVILEFSFCGVDDVVYVARKFGMSVIGWWCGS